MGDFRGFLTPEIRFLGEIFHFSSLFWIIGTIFDSNFEGAFLFLNNSTAENRGDFRRNFRSKFDTTDENRSVFRGKFDARNKNRCTFRSNFRSKACF